MQNSLKDLLISLELGTKLHISVVFLGGHGNSMTRLPTDYCVHKTAICDAAKSTAEGHAACMRCRNTVLKRVVKTKRPLSGCCINGIYEYCHPVTVENDVVCVLFIGHILNKAHLRHKQLYSRFSSDLISALQEGFSEDDCIRTAEILETYILLLLDKYRDYPAVGHDMLIENIKSYIEENMFHDLSMKELAYIFSYNEKYLGRLFKDRTGQTVKEYCNRSRVETAKKLLISSDKSVADISAAVGFNNVTYFNRLFKALVGKSPTEFKKG